MRLINLSFLFFIVISLSGCATQKVRTEYKDVYLPVYTVPEPPVIEKPILPINALTTEERNDDGILVKAAMASVAEQSGYIKQLEKIIETYKKISDDNKKYLPPNLLFSEIPLMSSAQSAFDWTYEQWLAYYKNIQELNKPADIGEVSE
jgi:hypothetical protein